MIIRNKKPKVLQDGKYGEGTDRHHLSIRLDLISDTLRQEKDIKAATQVLGCSRGYIYQELGVEKVREFVNAGA
jgi:hypothetical protein